MLYIVIAVLIILVVMNLFMVLVLRQMVLSTGKQIEKDAVRLFSAYDGIIEKKSQKLRQLEEELEEKKQNQKMESTFRQEEASTRASGEACVVTGRYRDETFCSDYQMVKENFCTDPGEILKRIQKELPRENRTLAVIDGILEKFSFDICYEMLTLSEEQQDQILNEFLEPDEQALREAYIRETGIRQLQPFYQWLLAQKRMLDQSIELRVGTSLRKRAEELEDQAVPSYEPEICEGFQVKAGNRLYDYSI